MKKQMSYKAKRSMIILAVIVILAIIASIGTYAFISGNDETQAMSQTNGTASDRAGQEVEQAQEDNNQGTAVQSDNNQSEEQQNDNDGQAEQIDVADATDDNAGTTTSANNQGTDNAGNYNGTTTTNTATNTNTSTSTDTTTPTTQTVTTTEQVERTETLVGFRTASLDNVIPVLSATFPDVTVPEDTTAPVYINMGIFNWTNDNDGDPDRTEDKLYATNGSHIRLFVTFPEMLGTNPKVDIYGKDDKVVATYELKYNGAEFYYVEFDISPDWDLPEGKIKYKVYGYADEAGNVGKDLTQEDTLSKENPYVIFDKTAPGTGNQFEGFPLYILNISANNEDDIDQYPSHYQYIKEGKTLKIEANFTEMLDPYTKPEVTIKNGDKALTGYYLEYRDKLGDKYRYTVDIPLNKENNSILQFEDGQKVEFTITNVRDIAGNYAEFNNNNVTQYYRNDVLVYDQVTYDETAPVTDYVGILNVTHLRLNNNGANEVLDRATNGDEVRVLVRFAEPLTVEPTVKLGGREYTAKYNKGISGDTGYYYYAADIELEEAMNLEDGKEIPFKICGYEDAAGNVGDTLNNENINTKYEKVVYDATAPRRSASNILVYGDSNELGTYYATVGDKIQVYISFNEKLAHNPTFTLISNGKQYPVDSSLVTAEEPNKDGKYIYQILYDVNENTELEDGQITFKITDMEDLYGNKILDETEPSNHHVLYLDRQAPKTGVDGFPLFFLNYRLDDKRPYTVIKDGEKLFVEANFTEKLAHNPKISLIRKDETKTEAVEIPYVDMIGERYRYYAVLPFDAKDLQLENGDRIKFEIADVEDKAGNTATFNNDNVTSMKLDDGREYGQVFYDNKAPEYYSLEILNITHYEENEKIKKENENIENEADKKELKDLKVARTGDRIRVLISFPADGEKLAVEPKLRINGIECGTIPYSKPTSTSVKRPYYLVDFTIADETNIERHRIKLDEGLVNIEVYGYEDAAGNTISESLTNKDIRNTNYTEVTYDVTPAQYTVLRLHNDTHLNNGGDLNVATNDDYLRFGIHFNEKLSVEPTLVIEGSGPIESRTFTMTFRPDSSKTDYEYMADVKLTEEMGLPQGEVKFKVYGYEDAAGNIISEENALTEENINHETYSGVVYDTTPPQVNKVHIYNQKNGSQHIKAGDTIRIDATFNEELGKAPVLTIGNQYVTLDRKVNEEKNEVYYQADLTLKDDNELDQGVIPFTLTEYEDLAGNSGIALDQSVVSKDVIYDSIKPSQNVYEVKIQNNTPNKIGDKYFAKAGDTVWVYVTFNEKLSVDPKYKFTIGDKTYYVDGKLNESIVRDDVEVYKYYGEIKIDRDMPNELINFEIYGYKDLAGNEGDPLTETTDTPKSSMTIDTTKPILTGAGKGITYNTPVTLTSTEQNFHNIHLKINGKTEKGYELGTPLTADGEYTVYIVDKAGNKSNTLNFVIDRTGPNVEVHYSNTNQSNTIYSTKDNVDVTITANEPIQVVDDEDWTCIDEEGLNFKKTFTKNTKYDLTIKDLAGNETYVRIDVKRIDKDKPNITLNGAPEITLTVGQEYVEEYAEAYDEVDKMLNAQLAPDQIRYYDVNGELVNDNVESINPVQPGKYELIYRAKDKAGNEADDVTRIVIVKAADDDTTSESTTETITDSVEE